jgi:hypothetical protein
MTNKTTLFGLIIFLTLLSCDNFEKDFYSQIDNGQKLAIEKNSAITFSLSNATQFEWEKVLIVLGNESVPVYAKEIEPHLSRKATDLDVNMDRYYFFTSENNLIIKEIESGIMVHNPAIEFEECIGKEEDIFKSYSKNEAVFTLIPNSNKIGEGTVFLFPNCETKFDRTNFGIFRKEEKTVGNTVYN